MITRPSVSKAINLSRARCTCQYPDKWSCLRISDQDEKHKSFISSNGQILVGTYTKEHIVSRHKHNQSTSLFSAGIMNQHKALIQEDHWYAYIWRASSSETVQFDGVLRDSFFCQEVGDFHPLITLQLDDLTHLLVVDECAIASEFLHISVIRFRTECMIGFNNTFLKAFKSFLESYSVNEKIRSEG